MKIENEIDLDKKIKELLDGKRANSINKLIDSKREEIKKGNNGILSELLVNELENTLNKKKQAIFLLNRRGHNTFVSCPSCGYVFNCDNCSISLTYHSHNSKLSCHYCGANYKVPSTCPSCNNTHIKFSGYGTQKAYEELSLIFPNAIIFIFIKKIIQ